MSNVSELNFETIENPYNSNLERSDYGVFGDTSESSVQSASDEDDSSSQQTLSVSETSSPVITTGQSLTDVWLETWIKSRNYKPGVQGFMIDGRTGNFYGANIFLTGGTIAYGKSSFTDSVNAGYIFSSDGIYIGAAGDSNYLKYDIGTATFALYGVNVDTSTITNIQSGSEIAIQGWQQDMTFSATDYRIVAWGAGTITLLDGTTYSITGANTGNISALTYIYLDISSSITVLQTSTTPADAVGSGKILIAVAQNNTDITSQATYQVFGGDGGILLAVDNIAANAASVNEFVANTANIKDAIINNAKISDLNVGKLTAGEIISKAITLSITPTDGDVKIQSGKTDFGDTTNGFILGIDDSDSDKVKFEMGGATDYITMSNGIISIAGAITINSGSGIANLTDAGALATADTADFDTEVSGAEKPEDNATLGADWSVDLDNIPATLGTPSSDGLYLSASYLGYYKTGAWTSYIRDNGDFYFAGDAGSSIDWNVTTASTLTVKGKIQTGTGSIVNGTYVDSLVANKITAGTGIINSLSILSTLTMGASGTDGTIQSYGWNGTANGFQIKGGSTPNFTLIGGTITGSTITGSTIKTNNVTYPYAQMNASGIQIAGQSVLNFITSAGLSSGHVGADSGQQLSVYCQYNNLLIGSGSGSVISSSNLIPSTDGSKYLGNSSYGWERVYLGSSSRYLYDNSGTLYFNGSAVGGSGTVTSIATSGAISGGTITTSGTISHLTSAGYKHIPTGGSSQQFLKYSSSGTAVWAYLGATANATTIVPGSGTTNLGDSTYYWNTIYGGKLNLKALTSNPSNYGDIVHYVSGGVYAFRGITGSSGGSYTGSFDLTAY